jgi:hypothetical protein
VSVTKASQDPRPESYKLNVDTIKVGEELPTSNGWRQRKDILRPLMRESMCQIRRERDEHKSPTLGIFRPAKIERLLIEPDAADWTSQQLANLVPHKFKYQFRCNEADCRGQGEAYRQWRDKYDEEWESAFRQKFEDQTLAEAPDAASPSSFASPFSHKVWSKKAQSGHGGPRFPSASQRPLAS